MTAQPAAQGWALTTGHRLNSQADGGHTIYCQWACRDVPLTKLTTDDAVATICSGCARAALVRQEWGDQLTAVTFHVGRVKDTGRFHRYDGDRSYDTVGWSFCGLKIGGLDARIDLDLVGVGEIEADPNRFLCGRCFPPTLRRHALLAYRRPDVAAAEDLLREAGLAKRDFAHTLVDHSGAPDRFIRWESGEVWDWTPGAEQLVMFAAALGHSLDTGDRPRPFPKSARPTLGLPHYRLTYRDKNFLVRLVKGVLAYRYWNTGICSVAVVAKEGGAADWGAYIGALPNLRPWVVEGHPVPNASSYVSEEEVVAHVIREGAKLTPGEARVFFADRRVRGIALRGGQAGLPMEAYRP